ncbi:MAG: adenine phosphoribosyltransferase [Candidatus Margulisbacteria bacterium]|nr:adenine phosphoribosyltransferase [Candidatus Margulisiibacteriota bacterium]
MDLKKWVRDIPDFPKKGIIFKDITPLLNNAKAFRSTIKQMADALNKVDFDVIAGVESRGFIFAAALAYKCKKRFVPIRKKNKLPHEVHSMEYDLEYGKDILEIHKDALTKKDKVVVVDDVLATGGTIHAIEKLLQLTNAQTKAIVFLMELDFLKGRSKLSCKKIVSLIHY